MVGVDSYMLWTALLGLCVLVLFWRLAPFGVRNSGEPDAPAAQRSMINAEQRQYFASVKEATLGAAKAMTAAVCTLVRECMGAWVRLRVFRAARGGGAAGLSFMNTSMLSVRPLKSAPVGREHIEPTTTS